MNRLLKSFTVFMVLASCTHTSATGIQAVAPPPLEIDKQDSNGRTSLMTAAADRNTALVLKLLDAGANVIMRDAQGQTALELALRADDLPAVNALLARGANVNLPDTTGGTALMTAAETGNAQAIDALLAHGANVLARDDDLMSALMYARSGVHNDYAAIVKTLIRLGLNINAKAKYGETALMHRAKDLSSADVKTLLDAGADPNIRSSYGITALMWVPLWSEHDLHMGGREELCARMATYLIDGGADINARDSDGMTALMTAAERRHYETLQTLLDRGADVKLTDHLGRTALTFGARDVPNGKIVPALLKKGARIDLIEAMLLGDRRKARLLIRAGARVDARGGLGDTPLMIASEMGDFGLVDLLLRRNVNVNSRDDGGNTAIMLAIGGRYGWPVPGGGYSWRLHTLTPDRTRIIQALAARKADVDASSKDKETALEWAGRQSNGDATALLIALGANANRKDRYQNPQILSACRNGMDSVAQALIAKGVRWDNVGQQSLTLEEAAERCNVTTVRALLRAGIPVDLAETDGSTALMCAARAGKADTVEALIAAGARVNAIDHDGETALLLSADRGRADRIVRDLMRAGSRTGVIEALLTGDRDSAGRMIARGARVDAKTTHGHSPLLIAAERGDLDMVRTLLSRGVGVEREANDRTSPILGAIGGRRDSTTTLNTIWLEGGPPPRVRMAIVALLVSKGARVNEISGFDETPLLLAAELGEKDLVEYLLDKGATVDSPNHDSETALMRAAQHGHSEIAELLLSKGATVNAVNSSDRCTALMYAARTGSIDTVQLLLQHNADVHMKAQFGFSALTMATDESHEKIVEILKSAGETE